MLLFIEKHLFVLLYVFYVKKTCEILFALTFEKLTVRERKEHIIMLARMSWGDVFMNRMNNGLTVEEMTTYNE